MDTTDEQSGSLIDRRAGDGHRAPVLPAPATELPADVARALLPALRRFHRGDPGAAAELTAPGEDYLPVLLHAYHTPGRTSGDDPFIFVLTGGPEDVRFRGLAAMLSEAAAGFASRPDQATALAETLTALQHAAWDLLAGGAPPADASSLLRRAARALEQERSADASHAAARSESIERLVGALPPGARLLALDEHTALSLFLLAAEHGATKRREALRNDVTRLRRLMRDLLRAERAKLVDSSRPEALLETVGDAASAHVDVERLASVLGAPRGVEALDPGRRHRIESVTDVFDRFLARAAPPLVHVVSDGPRPESLDDGSVTWHAAPPDGVCRTAVQLSDDEARRAAEVFGALRVARLLEAGAYDPARHDPLLDAFDPDAFSADELRALTPIVVLESAAHLAGGGMIQLSSLLRRGHPVHVIVPVQPASDPGLAPDADPISAYRFELAYIGISHREAVVHQSSAARPEHLLRGFAQALDGTHASLHIVTSGLTGEGVAPRLGAWAHTGAALEGRGHPFVHYNPEAGETWARRIDIAGNPQPESDWPVYELDCRDVNGNPESLPLAFTFADYALLEHRYCDHFRVIPNECDHDDLLLLGAYLHLDPDEADHRLPFIWAADAEGQMHRLLVSRRLMLACRDRLDYWRTLQELAGVRNEYVREAVEAERERLEAGFADERQRLEAAHAQAVDAARREAAQAAMQRLARALLSADTTTAAAMLAGGAAAVPEQVKPPPAAPLPSAGISVTSVPAEPRKTGSSPPAEATPAPPGSEPETETEAEKVAEPEEPEEPWIDSVLCTSCNDCLDINSQVFVYNGNKQATIGNPRAGTYAQLVQAAEKCPARCIHPGTPLNPGEPGLDELIERAKVFG